MQASRLSADAIRQIVQSQMGLILICIWILVINRVSLEKVDKFCYLGDMLDADGGCDSAVTTRVRAAWKKFREYLPILTGK